MSEMKKNIGAAWWHDMLSRREANKRLAKLGLTAALVSGVSLTVGCGDDEGEEVAAEHNALDLQKSEGWNVGSEGTPLTLANRATTDSRGSLDWSTYTDPSALMRAYAPKQSQWQPYVVPTLMQSLSQQSLRGQVGPVFTPAMKEAYSRGLGMKEILKNSKNPESMMLVVDLPGPEAVAYAAALSDVADVITDFDNWPHPQGVVPSDQTLGALLYYAGEVEANAAKRPATAPAVLILDSNRLLPYSDGSDQFDNRYIAKLPTTENLTSLKISNVLYAVPNEQRTAELDDINEDFVAYREKGVPVSMIPLTHFQPSNEEPVAQADSTGTSRNVVHHTYHYGGGLGMMPWFFLYYPMFGSRMGSMSTNGLRRTSFSRPAYQPARRSTMFSSRTVGGGTGVGKQRPSGFGRVSTRGSSVSSSGSSRSGRSGSFGRSGGGRSS